MKCVQSRTLLACHSERSEESLSPGGFFAPLRMTGSGFLVKMKNLHWREGFFAPLRMTGVGAFFKMKILPWREGFFAPLRMTGMGAFVTTGVETFVNILMNVSITG